MESLDRSSFASFDASNEFSPSIGEQGAIDGLSIAILAGLALSNARNASADIRLDANALVSLFLSISLNSSVPSSKSVVDESSTLNGMINFRTGFHGKMVATDDFFVVSPFIDKLEDAVGDCFPVNETAGLRRVLSL